jgi:MarR family transcriptional regulator, transcriptional regulator for hemolysin
MADRFSGSVLRSDAGDAQLLPSLGEIGLNNFAPYLMNRIMARWNSNVAEGLEQFDMTTAQMRALAVLSVSTSVTINELSVFAVTEQSTMSRTLRTLEELGYIRRQPRPDDMRVRDVSITARGRAAFDKVWSTMYRGLQRMFDGVEEDEYRIFLGTLHKVLRNIRKHDI